MQVLIFLSSGNEPVIQNCSTFRYAVLLRSIVDTGYFSWNFWWIISIMYTL